MNYRLISRLLSRILIIMAMAFTFCLFVDELFLKPETLSETRGFEWSIIITLSLALFFHFPGKKANMKFFRKEALCLIGVGWFLAIFVGSLPYWFIEPQLGWANGVFESASGLTTTGATILDDPSILPVDLIFWRAMSQWIGGLGVVVFFVAVLSSLGAGAKMLYTHESSGHSSEVEYARIQTGVLRIIGIYMGLSLLCTIAYHLAGMNWFDAITHMFTTISTGGFGNIKDFNSPAIEWVAVVFMIIGGTSFFIILKLLQRNWKQVRYSTETWAYYGLLIAVSLLVFFLLSQAHILPNIHERIRASVFQVVSIMTTTGFSTKDYTTWGTSEGIIFLALMFIGGSSGSTSGGSKVIRCVIAIEACFRRIEKSFRTRIIRPIKVNNQVVDSDSLDNIFTFLILLGLLTGASSVVMSILQPKLSPTGTIASVYACLFNIGPGLAEVGPAKSYATLGSPAKCFLSFLMVMGRLELYAVLVLFVPSLWKRY